MFFPLWLRHLFGSKTLAQCGHKTYMVDRVRAHGGSAVTELAIFHHGKFEYCHRCLAKMAIQCAKCGEPIFIGDGIALGVAEDESAPRPLHSKTYTTPDGILNHILCLRHDCGHSLDNLAGFWVPPGTISHLLHGMTRAATGRASKNKTELFF